MTEDIHLIAFFLLLILLTGKKNLSPEKMAEMQRKIDEERRTLESKKDIEEEEKNKVQTELQRREDELKKAQWVSYN